MENNTIKTFFRVFGNYEEDNWARFLLMAKFPYDNIKNTSTSHTTFEQNCDYHH